jgi:hypothetical protein
VVAYPFYGYWEDIGTVKSFFEENLKLTRHVGGAEEGGNSQHTCVGRAVVRGQQRQLGNSCCCCCLDVLTLCITARMHCPAADVITLSVYVPRVTCHSCCAHMQPAEFEFYDPQSPIYTSPRVLPPATVENSTVNDAIVAQVCVPTEH